MSFARTRPLVRLLRPCVHLTSRSLAQAHEQRTHARTRTRAHTHARTQERTYTHAHACTNVGDGWASRTCAPVTRDPLEVVEHGAKRLVQVYIAEFVPAQGPTVLFWLSASLFVCVCVRACVYKTADLSHWRTVISDLASFLARSRRSRYSSSSSVELSVSSSDASWRCCSARVGLEARGVLRFAWSRSSSPPALLDLSSESSSLQCATCVSKHDWFHQTPPTMGARNRTKSAHAQKEQPLASRGCLVRCNRRRRGCLGPEPISVQALSCQASAQVTILFSQLLLVSACAKLTVGASAAVGGPLDCATARQYLHPRLVSLGTSSRAQEPVRRGWTAVGRVSERNLVTAMVDSSGAAASRRRRECVDRAVFAAVWILHRERPTVPA